VLEKKRKMREKEKKYFVMMLSKDNARPISYKLYQNDDRDGQDHSN
jgi:hypothetical protein